MGLRQWLRSRRPVPAEVRSVLGVQPGERVLATAALDDAATAVATDARLVVADASGRRLDLDWADVDHATWDPESGQLVVLLVDGEVQRLLLADPRTLLPEVVRERVQSSVVHTYRVETPDRRGVRVVARRGREGLVLQVLADPGVDLEQPDVAREVAHACDEVSRAVGLEPG
jgi:predicted aminopeptidase